MIPKVIVAKKDINAGFTISATGATGATGMTGVTNTEKPSGSQLSAEEIQKRAQAAYDADRKAAFALITTEIKNNAIKQAKAQAFFEYTLDMQKPFVDPQPTYTATSSISKSFSGKVGTFTAMLTATAVYDTESNEYTTSSSSRVSGPILQDYIDAVRAGKI